MIMYSGNDCVVNNQMSFVYCHCRYKTSEYVFCVTEFSN